MRVSSFISGVFLNEDGGEISLIHLENHLWFEMLALVNVGFVYPERAISVALMTWKHVMCVLGIVQGVLVNC